MRSPLCAFEESRARPLGHLGQAYLSAAQDVADTSALRKYPNDPKARVLKDIAIDESKVQMRLDPAVPFAFMIQVSAYP